MTISLTVILMETTGMEPSFFFPIILTLISAKWVGDYFNEGIYDIQVAVNHVPMMPWEPLSHYRGLKASDVMSAPAVCVMLQDKANYIYDILTRYKHNGFPVVEDVKGVSNFNLLLYPSVKYRILRSRHMSSLEYLVTQYSGFTCLTGRYSVYRKSLTSQITLKNLKFLICTYQQFSIYFIYRKQSLQLLGWKMVY